jgi:hypothetical protein
LRFCGAFVWTGKQPLLPQSTAASRTGATFVTVAPSTEGVAEDIAAARPADIPPDRIVAIVKAERRILRMDILLEVAVGSFDRMHVCSLEFVK